MRILVTDGMDKTAMAQLREAGHEVVEQPGVFGGAHAVAEPSRLQMFDHLANVPRPEQFAAVRHARQTGLARDAKGGLPVGSGAAAFVVAEAERDHPVLARVPGRESGDGAGVQWVTHAAGGHDDRHLHTRFGAGPRGQC